MSFATIRSPSMQPISGVSFFALVVAACLYLWLHSSEMHPAVVLVAVVIPLAFAAITKGSLVYSLLHHRRAFSDLGDFLAPDLSSFLAADLYLAFGFGCALAGARKSRSWGRPIGNAALWIYGSFLSATLAVRGMALLAPSARSVWPALLGSVAGYSVLWIIVTSAIRRKHRSRRENENGA